MSLIRSEKIMFRDSTRTLRKEVEKSHKIVRVSEASSEPKDVHKVHKIEPKKTKKTLQRKTV